MGRWIVLEEDDFVRDNSDGWCGSCASEDDAKNIARRHKQECDHYEQRIAELTAELARVKAPLLAEIQRLGAEVSRIRGIADTFCVERNNVMKERDTLKTRAWELESKIERQAAELTKLYHLRQGDAGERLRLQNQWNMAARAEADRTDERDTLRAELEAIKEIPEVAELITRRPDESLYTAVMRLRNERNDLCNKLSSRDERVTSLVSELEAVKAERDELRQPVDVPHDVPQGVPSVEALTEIGLSAEVKAAAGGRSHRACSEAFATAIRDAVLAGVGQTPTAAPTDAEIEALARVLDTAYETEAGGHTPWRDQSPCHQDRRCAQARAAFANIGTRQGECQQCAKWKSYGTKMEDNARVLAKRIDKTRMSIDAARAALEGE